MYYYVRTVIHDFLKAKEEDYDSDPDFGPEAGAGAHGAEGQAAELLGQTGRRCGMENLLQSKTSKVGFYRTNRPDTNKIINSQKETAHSEKAAYSDL